MYISKLRQIQYLIGWFVVVAEGRGSIWRAGLACRERPHVVQTSPPDQLGQVWISLSVYIRIHLHSLTQHWDNILHPTIFRLQFYLCTLWKVCATDRNVGHLQIRPMSRWWSPLLIVLLLFQTWDASFRLKGSGWAASAIRATMVQQGGDFTRRPVHKCARPAHNGPSATRPPTPQMERGCSTGSSLRWRWSTLMPRCRSCRGGRLGGSCHLSLIINQTKRYLHCPTLPYIVSPPTETKLNKDCTHHCRAEFHQCNSCHLSNYQSKHTYLHCWHKGNWALQRYKVHATQWISLFCTVMLVQSWSFALVVQGSMCKCAVKAEMWFVFICSQQRKTWQTNLLEQANSCL